MPLVQYYLTPHFSGDYAHGSSSSAIVFRVAPEEMVKYFNDDSGALLFVDKKSDYYDPATYNCIVSTIVDSAVEIRNITPYNQRNIAYCTKTTLKDDIENDPDSDDEKKLNVLNSMDIDDETKVPFLRNENTPFVHTRTDISEATFPLNFIYNLYLMAKMEQYTKQVKNSYQDIFSSNVNRLLTVPNIQAIDIVPDSEDIDLENFEVKSFVTDLLIKKWTAECLKYHGTDTARYLSDDRHHFSNPSGTLYCIDIIGDECAIFIPDDRNPANVIIYQDDDWEEMTKDWITDTSRSRYS